MSKKEIRVALIGHQFMGIAHSNAFRNAAMWANILATITMKCLCAKISADLWTKGFRKATVMMDFANI